MRTHRLTLRQRLWGGMLALTLTVAVSGGISLWLGAQMEEEVTTLTEVNMEETIAATGALTEMLQARRSEKDFVIRKDLKYLGLNAEAVGHARQELEKVVKLSPDATRREDAAAALNDLAAYEENFKLYAAQIEKIGLTHETGLMGTLRKAVHEVETSLKDLKFDDLKVHLLMCRRHEKDYLARRDPKYIDNLFKTIELFEKGAAAHGVDPADLLQWRKQWEAYRQAMTEIRQADEALEKISNTFRAATQSAEDRITRIAEQAEKQIPVIRAQVMSKLNTSEFSSWTITSIAVAIGVIVPWLTVRQVTRPLVQMTNRARTIASGDLRGQALLVHTNDEIGQLTSSINEMQASLKRLVDEVGSSAMSVTAAATQIAATGEEMASRMSEQLTQTSQIGAAIEEMSASVVEVARNCQDAAGQASEAGRDAGDGGRIVGEAVEGINAIAVNTDAVAQVVDELGKRGEQIGQIIGVINDIADQTNLLALNAAIEAARAGDQGRGFAVVADEVRKLADRTTRATEEIADSINAMRTDTAQAVNRMSDTRKLVADGVSKARQAGGSLTKIVGNADNVASMIQSISSAAQEQSAAAEQVARNAETMTTVSSKASEGAQQAAQAAAQLSEKAEVMQRLVSEFKV